MISDRVPAFRAILLRLYYRPFDSISSVPLSRFLFYPKYIQSGRRLEPVDFPSRSSVRPLDLAPSPPRPFRPTLPPKPKPYRPTARHPIPLTLRTPRPTPPRYRSSQKATLRSIASCVIGISGAKSSKTCGTPGQTCSSTCDPARHSLLANSTLSSLTTSIDPTSI